MPFPSTPISTGRKIPGIADDALRSSRNSLSDRVEPSVAMAPMSIEHAAAVGEERWARSVRIVDRTGGMSLQERAFPRIGLPIPHAELSSWLNEASR